MNGNPDYLLDTNIIIAFLKGDPIIVQCFQEQLSKRALYLSQITQMELLSFPAMTLAEEQAIRQCLDQLIILPIDDSIIAHVIALRRKNRLKLPDAIIAATALSHDLILVSCDKELLNCMPASKSLNPSC